MRRKTETKYSPLYSCMLCDDMLPKKTYDRIRVNGKEASAEGYLCRNCYLKLIFETAPHQIKSTIRKSGGALVFTIPKALAEYHNIQQGDEIIISDVGMRIIKKRGFGGEKFIRI